MTKRSAQNAGFGRFFNSLVSHRKGDPLNKYSEDYYREQFHGESTERLLFLYANEDLNYEASEAIYGLLSKRGEVPAHKTRTQKSSDIGIVRAGCLIVALLIFMAFMMLVMSLVGDVLPSK